MRPPRLERVFSTYDGGIYFVTCCTTYRTKWLACEQVHAALRNYAIRGEQMGAAALGRYVIMPDHLHVFVRLSPERTLKEWTKGLKAVLGRGAGKTGQQWQPGFFDHLLRQQESYSAKWEYVRQNPVRAGFVSDPDEWPYQGEIVQLHWL